MGIRRSDLQPLVITGSFTRPADTTAYASGDLVANSTTVADVAPITFSFPEDTTPGNATAKADKSVLQFMGVKLAKSGTSTTNASFRVHLFSQNPCATSPLGITNADNGAFSVNKAGYIGSVDITLLGMKDGAVAVASADMKTFGPEEATLFAFVEARAAYTPASEEVFTVELSAYRI